MKNLDQMTDCFSLKVKSVACFSICILLTTTFNQAYADRFSAPDLNAPLGDFEQRLNSSELNVDFIVALTFNKARKIERDVEEFSKRTRTEVFSNLNKSLNNATNNIQNGFSSNSAISNSVVVPPGTKADTIIIINITDGDSFAIHR